MNCLYFIVQRTIFAALAALTVSLVPVRSQERADPLAIGASRSTVATSRGISSLYTNIGGLSLDGLVGDGSLQRVEVDIALAPIGIAAGSTYLNSSELNFVFDDKDCGVFSDSDRIRLGQLLERDRLAADVAVDLASLRVRIPGLGALGVQYGHRIRARMNFPEEFRQNVLGSGDVFASSNRYDGADVGGEWMTRIAFTLASAWHRTVSVDSGDVWLPVIGFGAGVSALEGIVHFDVDPSSVVNTTVLASGSGPRRLAVSGHYAFRSAVPDNFDPSAAILRPGFGRSDSTRANGIGGTIGVSAVILRRVHIEDESTSGSPLDPEVNRRHATVTRDAITFGAIVDDIGSLDWTGTNLRRSRTIDTVVSDEGGGLTYELLCKYRGDLDTVGPFTSYLPAQLRIGAGFDIRAFIPSIKGDLVAGIEAAFDLNDAIGQEPTRLSIGGHWMPFAALTVSSGVQIGGRQGFAWSAGASLQPLKWLSIAAATSDWTGMLAARTLQYDLTFRVATHFRF